MHHLDRAYDTSDPGLSEKQRSHLTFPTEWFNRCYYEHSPFFGAEEEEEEAQPTAPGAAARM